MDKRLRDIKKAELEKLKNSAIDSLEEITGELKESYEWYSNFEIILELLKSEDEDELYVKEFLVEYLANIENSFGCLKEFFYEYLHNLEYSKGYLDVDIPEKTLRSLLLRIKNHMNSIQDIIVKNPELGKFISQPNIYCHKKYIEELEKDKVISGEASGMMMLRATQSIDSNLFDHSLSYINLSSYYESFLNYHIDNINNIDKEVSGNRSGEGHKKRRATDSLLKTFKKLGDISSCFLNTDDDNAEFIALFVTDENTTPDFVRDRRSYLKI